jgi:tetratricopeptide (TPR) repeat protein
MGMAYFSLGRTNAACAAFAKGLELNPSADGRLTYTEVLKGCAKDRFSVGEQAYRDGRFEDAIDILGDVARDFPDFAPAYAYMGHAYSHSRPSNPVRAEDAYRRALEAAQRYVLPASERAVVLDNLGMIRMEYGDFEEAHSLLARAVDLDTDYPVAYFNFGCVLALAGRHTEASVAFADAVRRDTNFLTYVSHHSGLAAFRATQAYTNLVQSFQTE